MSLEDFFFLFLSFLFLPFLLWQKAEDIAFALLSKQRSYVKREENEDKGKDTHNEGGELFGF